MAVYEKKFMLPYLKSLYTVELQYEKATLEKETAQKKLAEDEKIANEVIDSPQFPGDRGHFRIYYGLVAFALSFPLRKGMDWLLVAAYNAGLGQHKILEVLFILVGMFPWLLSWLMTVGGPIVLLLEILASFTAHQENVKKYEEALAQRNRALKRKEQYQVIIRTDEERMAEIQKQFDKIKDLREKLYQINVIPLPYRNSSSIEYMKAFFQRYGTADLDIVIREMLVWRVQRHTEELEDNMKKEWENQERQERLEEQIQRLQSDMKRELEEEMFSIEESRERQAKYLQMMESESLLAAFYSAD